VEQILTSGMEKYLFSFGGGGILGFLSGFALKRIIKLAAIILGVFILGLAYLSYKGWIHADWNTIQNQTYSAAFNASQAAQQYLHQTMDKISTHPGIQSQGLTISAMAGFPLGLIVGLRR
jgi:uncharacterized membrane protein (Fun14 family)